MTPIKCRKMYSYPLLVIAACRLQHHLTDFLKFTKSHDSNVTAKLYTTSTTQNIGTQIISHFFIPT